MNRLQKIYWINALRARIASFLAIATGTFMFWLVGFSFYRMINAMVISFLEILK